MSVNLEEVQRRYEDEWDRDHDAASHGDPDQMELLQIALPILGYDRVPSYMDVMGAFIEADFPQTTGINLLIKSSTG